MAVDTERRAKKIASRLEHALLLQPLTKAMSYTSANHSPEVGVRVADSTFLQSPIHQPFKPVYADQEPITQPQQPPSKRRRSSKSKVPGEIRRSSSTPHMRNLALSNSGELSPTSNKPRNKLGYHRTSVACGHCRRRKIRCLTADDPQGRCANCIRLKKDCNFFPVEHIPDGQQPQSVTTKDGTPGHPMTPATSSPHGLPAVGGEKVGEFRTPFLGTSSTPQNSAFHFHGDSETDSHHGPAPSGMPVQQPPYPYPHPIETQWPSTNNFLPSSTVAESPSSSTSYWRQSPSTANSTYGSETNVSGAHTPAALSTSSTMSYGHPEGHTWGGQPPFQPPTRSMSYGNIEGLPHQYAGQGLGIHHQDYPRRTPPYSYPTSLDTNPATIHATTMGGATSAPLSAPIVPSHQYYPPIWNTFEGAQSHGPHMPVPGRSMSVQWYAEPGHLDRVQEEAAAPAGYGHQGVQQFYSAA